MKKKLKNTCDDSYLIRLRHFHYSYIIFCTLFINKFLFFTLSPDAKLANPLLSCLFLYPVLCLYVRDMSVLLEIFDHAAVFSYRYIKSTFRSGSVVVLTFTFADLIEYKATKDIEFYLQDHGKVVCQGILFH